MSGPTSTISPSELETRLAALSIPVTCLIGAAKVPRSTWRDWRAGRTRPHPERWAGAIAAFDALVAEATTAPADVEPQAAGAEPAVLTGSSAPTGVPPTFVPVARAAPAGSPSPSAERNLTMLADLLQEMDRLCIVVEECRGRTVMPPVPDALFCRSADGLWAAGLVTRHQCGRLWYPPNVMDGLRAMTFEGDFIDLDGRYRRRRDEIVTTYEGWLIAREAACAASELDVADAEAVACGKRIVAFRDAILDQPAESFGDVLVKAAVVSWWYVDMGENAAAVFAADRARMVAEGDRADLAMALSVLSDLAAMAEAQGLTLDRPATAAGAGAVEAPIVRAVA